MCNLIASELFKIRKSKVTYVIASIFAIIALLQMAVIKWAESTGQAIGEITGIAGFVSPLGGDMNYIFIGIFITVMMCQDFSTGSIRQIISKGTSRTKYVLAKYVAMVVTAFAFIAECSILCFIGFTMIGEVGEINAEIIKHLLMYVLGAFCMILGYTAITELICILFRKSTITIPVNLLFIFFGGLISQIACLLTENEIFYKYWLANMSASFASFEIGYGDKMLYMEIFTVMASVFIWWSIFVFRKRDVD